MTSRKNVDLKPEHVTPCCNKKVWWCTDNGYKWLTKVDNRIRGTGCLCCLFTLFVYVVLKKKLC